MLLGPLGLGRIGKRVIPSNVEGFDIQPDTAQRFVNYELPGKHADGPGQSRGVRIDEIGRRGDVIATRSGRRAHRHHHRLASFARAYNRIPDLVRRDGRAAACIDPQNNGPHRRVVGRRLNGGAHLIASDQVAAPEAGIALARHDSALARDQGDDGTIACRGCRRTAAHVVFYGQNGLDAGCLERSLARTGNMPERIDQSCLLGLFGRVGAGHDQSVHARRFHAPIGSCSGYRRIIDGAQE